MNFNIFSDPNYSVIRRRPLLDTPPFWKGVGLDNLQKLLPTVPILHSHNMNEQNKIQNPRITLFKHKSRPVCEGLPRYSPHGDGRRQRPQRGGG